MNIDVVVICGSESDFPFAEDKIVNPLRKRKIEVELFAASAHKEPKRVLEIVDRFNGEKVIFITIAGRSNALSGFVAANSKNVTIACPPFKDKLDFLININSTLQMPSKTPVLTVIDPGNCVSAVERILKLQTTKN